MPVVWRDFARNSNGARSSGASGEGVFFTTSRGWSCVLCVVRNEVRSSFNLWSTLLADTRKLSRERASLAETLASEMVARLDIMAKDVHILTKKVCETVWAVAQGRRVWVGGQLLLCVLRSCCVCLAGPSPNRCMQTISNNTACLILPSSSSSAGRYVWRFKITS